MKPTPFSTTVPGTMWKGPRFYAERSSQLGGRVGRTTTVYTRISTYALRSTNISPVTAAPTNSLRVVMCEASPAISMRYVGAYNGNIDRVSRYHNACSRSESTLEQEACSSDQSKGSGEPKGGDRQFIWRTTENRFIDFCFSPEEEARLKLCHERIIASSWSSLTAKEVADCLLTQREREKVLQLSLLQRVRNFWSGFRSYVLSPRGLEESGRRLFRTILPRYEDTVLTAKCFGIGETDFNSRIYFLLVHLWSLHCALQKAGLETLKIKLWDALWDFLTNILIQEGASHTQDVPPDDGVSHSDLQVNEFKIPAVLREQQFTSLGFCVALDEAFEDEDAFPAGQLAHRLWVTVYDAKEKRRDCPELIALTTYSLRARNFALNVPRDALMMGAFRWPDWPPVKPFDSSRASDPQQKRARNWGSASNG